MNAKLNLMAFIVMCLVATVPVSAATTIVLNQPEDTALMKTQANQNYGAIDGLTVEKGGTANEKVSLVRFDLSAIPAGQTITSALFTLDLQWTNEGGSRAIPLHKMLKPWVEAGATWNESDYSGIGTNAWQVAGAKGAADAEVAAFATANHDNTIGNRTTWDITSAVVGWYATPASNYGFKVDPVNATNIIYFNSSEGYGNVAENPELTINYIPIPEPATLGLLAIGGLALLGRKRR
jgi:hypothetical protein